MLLARMEPRETISAPNPQPEPPDQVAPAQELEPQPKISPPPPEAPPEQQVATPPQDSLETEDYTSQEAAAFSTRQAGEWQSGGATAASRHSWRIPRWAWGGGALTAVLLVGALSFMHTGKGVQPDAPGGTNVSPWIPRASGTGELLSSIFATSDGSRVWAVGTNAVIVESDDGGASWNWRSYATGHDLTSSLLPVTAIKPGPSAKTAS